MYGTIILELINNPEELFDLPNCQGMVFHGYVQNYPINSSSCVTYNKRLLDYLNKLYKYIEFVRYNVYSNLEGKIGEKELSTLKELDELQEQCQEILEVNSSSISPIWSSDSSIVEYHGESLSSIYDNSNMHSSPKVDSSRIVEYCLASGIKELNGLFNYGAYGGPISYSFICQLYGKKAADEYKANSIECMQEFEQINSMNNYK